MSKFRKGLKLLKNTFIKPKLPTKLWIAVTDTCNSHCTMCNQWKEKGNPKSWLTPDELYKALSDPIFKNVDYIINSGGEPTMRSLGDLTNFLMAEHKALPKATLQFSTNGLNPQIAYAAIQHLVLEGCNVDVGISLDGLNEEHDSVRGVKGNFDRVVDLINDLITLRRKFPKQLKISVGTVLTEKTLPNISKIAGFCKILGIEHNIQWCNSGAYYGGKEHDPCLMEDVWVKMEDVVRDLNYPLLSDLWLKWLKGENPTFNCYALRDFMVIKANGDVVPCLNDWSGPVTNIKESNFPHRIKHHGIYFGIKDCDGCLNSWATYWSWEADGWPLLKYFLLHPWKVFK